MELTDEWEITTETGYIVLSIGYKEHYLQNLVNNNTGFNLIFNYLIGNKKSEQLFHYTREVS